MTPPDGDTTRAIDTARDIEGLKRDLEHISGKMGENHAAVIEAIKANSAGTDARFRKVYMTIGIGGLGVIFVCVQQSRDLILSVLKKLL